MKPGKEYFLRSCFSDSPTIPGFLVSRFKSTQSAGTKNAFPLRLEEETEQKRREG